jgi:hypothetical protein
MRTVIIMLHFETARVVKVTFCVCSFTCIIGKDEVTLNSVRAMGELANYFNNQNSDTRKI